MENKKSFLIYCDIIHSIDHLTNEEKGLLFQHLLEYVNDMNPVMDNRVILSSWKPIERQLKRDLQKYVETCGKNRDNALKRWNKKDTTAYDRIRPNANHADKDNDNDNDIDNDTDKEIRKKNLAQAMLDREISFKDFWELYDKRTGKDKCLKKWITLKPEETEKILRVVDDYAKSTPELKFRKDPITWLNGKHWNDEIEKQNVSINRPRTNSPII